MCYYINKQIIMGMLNNTNMEQVIAYIANRLLLGVIINFKYLRLSTMMNSVKTISNDQT